MKHAKKTKERKKKQKKLRPGSWKRSVLRKQSRSRRLGRKATLSLSRSVRKNKGRVVALSTRESERGLQKIEEDEVPKRGTLRTTTCRAVKKAPPRDREKGLPIASKTKFPNGNAESDGLRTPPPARSQRFWRNCLARRNFFPKHQYLPEILQRIAANADEAMTIVMKEEDVRRCEIQAWYPAFRRHSLRTLILPLPEEFISFLMRDDGLYLPKDSLAIPTRTQVQNPQLQAEDYVHWDEEDDEGDEPEVPSFPDLAKQVQTMIQSLGGAVFPKLNWSAPKDTAWISSSGSLKCQNFEEISLLLKASDNLIHDLCHAFDSCNDKSRERPAQFVLALRKWYDLRPEMEFRGFVRGKLLVGICQREVTGFYATLVGREDELEDIIASFFDVNVREVFGGEDYTFDVYLTKDLRVKLLDFNPWGGSTLPLLFSWDELEHNYAKVLGRLNGDGLSDDDLCLEVGRRVNLLESGKEEQTVVEETVVESTDLDPVHGSNGMTINAQRREVSRRVEFRVVKSEGLVQPGLRVGTGVPIDFVNQGAWEDIIKREAEKEAREQEKERAAGGG